MRLVVAVNKLDVVRSRCRFPADPNTVGWVVRGTLQWDRHPDAAFLITSGISYRNVTFIPCSGLSGRKFGIPIEAYPVEMVFLDLCCWKRRLAIPGQVEVTNFKNLSTLPLVPWSCHYVSPLTMSRKDQLNVVNITGILESGVLQAGDPIISEPGANQGIVKCTLGIQHSW